MSKPVKEIDIFQRTLKCRDLPLEEAEIEIFDSESDEIVEEEEIPIEPETEINPEMLYGDLECLKRQVQKLLLAIKAKFAPQPKPEETCEEEAAICALQKSHHKLQCHIYELIRCFQIIRQELREMYSNLCVESKDVEQLWRIVAFFKYWQEAIKGDEGVCHWRFVYVQHKKADWTEVEGLLCKNSRCPQLLAEFYLGVNDLHSRRVYLQAELEKLKNIFVYLFEMKNPSYADDFVLGQPLKEIELDYIKRQVKKNRALQDKDCKEYFKCDKIQWK